MNSFSSPISGIFAAGGEENRKVLLIVCGSIAVYKSAELCRYLVKRGYHVRVVMTESATNFVTPLTFEVLSGNPVLTNQWSGAERLAESRGSIEHIDFADWPDLILVAPATANVLAKMAGGIADDTVLSLLLATKAKILAVPAMNVNMWENPATVANIITLRARGVDIVEPDEGELACGWIGKGRFPEVTNIFYRVRRALSIQDFLGKKVLVTAGPTREYIDPVRFLSNRSSGKMGVAIAREAFRRGAEVTLVHGPIVKQVGAPIKTVAIGTANELASEVRSRVFAENGADVVIMAAAVADIKPESVNEFKLKKRDIPNSIPVSQNVDILASIGDDLKTYNRSVKLVGFAVETGEIQDLLDELERKLQSKNVDLMIGNFALDAFDLNTNRVWMLDKQGRREEVANTYKSRIAKRIFDKIVKI
jgi:phosphopantothenoylcysteine decarboxylase / phosphopantothenate---cysteine ligase